MTGFDRELILSWYIEDENGCWNWTRATTREGYGRVTYNGKAWGVHRLSYLHHYGGLTKGMHIDHLCHNRKCFNPQHLAEVPASVNTSRERRRFAETCGKGHPMTEGNVLYRKQGRRCRTCHAENERARRARRKQQQDKEKTS
jgi:hypothetical protein